jgi:DNA-binding response OmpR family regulator
MSGYSAQLLDENGRSQLKGDLLSKPFSSSELVCAVEAALTHAEGVRVAK